MGGGWNFPTGSQYLRGDVWGRHVRLEYGPEDWPSHSVFKFYWAPSVD